VKEVDEPVTVSVSCLNVAQRNSSQ
jgi:hypothetical protein